MKYTLKILIDSSNQDVVDFPKDTALKAIDRARKETQLMSFAPMSDDTVSAKIADSNGNTVGVAMIEVEGEDSD